MVANGQYLASVALSLRFLTRGTRTMGGWVGSKGRLEVSKGRKMFAPVVTAVLLDILFTAFISKAILDEQIFVFVNFSYVKRCLICRVGSLERRNFTSHILRNYFLISN
jgi:hypothetical protein